MAGGAGSFSPEGIILHAFPILELCTSFNSVPAVTVMGIIRSSTVGNRARQFGNVKKSSDIQRDSIRKRRGKTPGEASLCFPQSMRAAFDTGSAHATVALAPQATLTTFNTSTGIARAASMGVRTVHMIVRSAQCVRNSVVKDGHTRNRRPVLQKMILLKVNL